MSERTERAPSRSTLRHRHSLPFPLAPYFQPTPTYGCPPYASPFYNPYGANPYAYPVPHAPLVPCTPFPQPSVAPQESAPPQTNPLNFSPRQNRPNREQVSATVNTATNPPSSQPQVSPTITSPSAPTGIPSNSTTLTALQQAQFNITYDGVSSWANFISALEITADAANWTPQQSCLALVKALSGQAMDAVPTLPRAVMKHYDYQVLRAHLELRFANAVRPEITEAQLHRRVQSPTETPREYATALDLLARAAHPADPDRANQAAVTAFNNEIRDEVTSKLLRTVTFSSVFEAERYSARVAPLQRLDGNDDNASRSRQ